MNSTERFLLNFIAWCAACQEARNEHLSLDERFAIEKRAQEAWAVCERARRHPEFNDAAVDRVVQSIKNTFQVL